MSAHNLNVLDGENIYFHVFNKRTSGKPLFKDKGDYDTFLLFLKQYITPPRSKKANTTTFVIRGREYKGTPRQPKNYYQEIELVAYNLSPDHFHLVVKQVTNNSLKSFLNSLLTRYSIYFNKKYKRSGALFENSYKISAIEDLSCLAYLTKYLHTHSVTASKGNNEKYTSYPEYTGQKTSSWINTQDVLSLFNSSNNTHSSLKHLSSYKNFVEKHAPKEHDIKLLEKVAIEDIHLSKTRDSKIVVEEPEFVGSNPEINIAPTEELIPVSKIPAMVIITILFVSLFILGVKNIQTSLTKDLICDSSPTPVAQEVLSSTSQSTESEKPNLVPNKLPEPVVESTETEMPIELPAEIPAVSPIDILNPIAESTESEKPENTLFIKISEGFDAINIRKQPTIESEQIGMAKEGDTFEYVSLNLGWSGVKLKDGSIGYISADYVELIGGPKQ